MTDEAATSSGKASAIARIASRLAFQATSACRTVTDAPAQGTTRTGLPTSQAMYPGGIGDKFGGPYEITSQYLLQFCN